MHINALRIKNFRRLKDVKIDMDAEASIYVGANNSGKTSATEIFQFFLGSKHSAFSFYDFSAHCWALLDEIEAGTKTPQQLPTICLDIWFTVADGDIHRVAKILPSLDWDAIPVGVRLEFAPINSSQLIENYKIAKTQVSNFSSAQGSGFSPWPSSLREYLKRRLSAEYQIHYYVLDRARFSPELVAEAGYTPQALGNTKESGANIINSLLRVDYITAQRYLSDPSSKTISVDLSRRLSRFYERNLEKHDPDYTAVSALAESEKQFNAHLAKVFKPTLSQLNTLGYPGFADPQLEIRSSLQPESILTQSASVHYALQDPGRSNPSTVCPTLPDKYNGLGFKNLIYIVIEILDFHKQWEEEEKRPPLHLVIIEEPEAHLHTQLQQVFIRKVREIIPANTSDFGTQLIITTHSPHIIHASDFKPIRYFQRVSDAGTAHYSTVKNLSIFYDTEPKSREFLAQYIKLTHCDLFFADAAILVEGNVERLLLPRFINKAAPELNSKYITILEISGAFAHIFERLLYFLGLTTLVITDIDSIQPPPPKAAQAATGTDASTIAPTTPDELEDSDVEDENEDEETSSVCRTDTANAVTSNQTLIKWIPKKELITELLASTEINPEPTAASPARVYMAYQRSTKAIWKKEQMVIAGRTFEEAFAIENLEWCQNIKQKKLRLKVVSKAKAPTITINEIIDKIHKKVGGGSFNKTDFALALMMTKESEWKVPKYISDGLDWLKTQLIPSPPIDTSGH